MQNYPCNYCPTEIPVPQIVAGREVECPQCGKSTRMVRLNVEPAKAQEPDTVDFEEPAPVTLHPLWAMWILGVIALVGVCFFFRWIIDERDVQGIDAMNTYTTKLATCAILLALFTAFIVWLIRRVSSRRKISQRF